MLLCTKAGLKKFFVCRHSTLVLQLGLVGRDFFLFWGRLVPFPEPYRFLIKASSREKEPLSATIFIIVSDKAQVNQRKQGMRFNNTSFFNKQPNCYGTNIKNCLKVKQVAKQPPTWKPLMQKMLVGFWVKKITFSILNLLKLRFSTTAFGTT